MLVAEDLASGQLVCWGAAAGPPAEIWGLHASRRFASGKVKVFMRFLEAAFPNDWL